MSEEPERPKVVNLFTKAPHVPPEPAEPADSKSVDQEAVDLLEAALKDAKEGEITGVILLTGQRNDAGAIDFVSLHITESVEDAEQMFLGAVSTVPVQLASLVEIGYLEDD